MAVKGKNIAYFRKAKSCLFDVIFRNCLSVTNRLIGSDNRLPELGICVWYTVFVHLFGT